MVVGYPIRLALGLFVLGLGGGVPCRASSTGMVDGAIGLGDATPRRAFR